MFTRVAVTYPRATLVAWLMILLACAAGIPRTTAEVGYRILLGDDHPSILEIDRFIERYGGGLPVVVAWGCGEGLPCESALDERSLEMAAGVEAALGDHRSVKSIASPANTPILVPGQGGVSIRRLWDDGVVSADLADLANRASVDPAWVGALINESATVGAIVIQTASADSQAMQDLVEELFAALAPYEALGFEFHPIGDPIDFVVAGGEMKAETPKIMPVLVGLLAAVTFILCRSIVSVLVSLGVSGVSLVVAMGLMGWLGWPEVEWTQALPPFVLVASFCNSVHLLARLAAVAAEGDGPRLALDEVGIAARDVAIGCFVASVTTATSVLSFMTSGFESFFQFGVIAAVGVMTSLVVTFSMVPALMTFVPRSAISHPARENAWSVFLSELVAFVSRRRGLLILVALASLLVSGLGLWNLSVDIDEQTLFGKGSKVVVWADWVEANLRKADGLEVEIELPARDSASEPHHLEIIGEVVGRLDQNPHLGRPSSLLDLLKAANRSFNDDDPAHYRVAPTTQENAMLLMVLGMSSGSVLDTWMTIDQQRVRLSIPADPMPMTQRVEVLAEVESVLDEVLPAGWSYTITGPLKVYADFVREIQRTQLSSFSTAAGVIWLILTVFLRMTGSRLGWAMGWSTVALVVSAFPVAVTLGAMGLLGINLDAGTAMVGAIVIGVAVDDSVHLIILYRRNRREGLQPQAAIEEAIKGAGRALVTTSLALSVGFFSLLMSSWGSIASFGFLSGVAVLGALGADLLILPSVVMMLNRASPHEPPPPANVPPGRGARIGLLACLGLASGAILSSAYYEIEPAPGEPASMLCEPAEGAIGEPGPCSSPGAGDADVRESWLSFIGRGKVLTDDVRPRAQAVGTQSPRSGAVHPASGGAITLMTLLVTGVLLLAAVLVRSSQSSAAVPFGVLAILTGILGACRVFGRVGAEPLMLEVAAMGIVWAPLLHLGLTFPTRHAFIQKAPGISNRLYAAAGVMLGPLLLGLFRFPGLFDIVLLACLGLAAMSGGVAFVRMFARPTPFAGLGVLGRNAMRSGLGTLAVVVCWAVSSYSQIDELDLIESVALVVLPVPVGIGLLVSIDGRMRFIGQSVLRTIVAMMGVSLLVVAGAASGIRHIDLPVSVPLVAVIFLSVLIGDLIRQVGRRGLALDSGVEDQRYKDRRVRFSRDLQSAVDADDVLGEMVSVLLEELEPRGLVVVGRGGDVRCGVGRGVSREARHAALSITDEATSPVWLSRDGSVDGRGAECLRLEGIELVVRMDSTDADVGCLCVLGASDQSQYCAMEREFVATIAHMASVGAQSAAMLEQSRRDAQVETIGRVGAGMMHDIGRRAGSISARAKFLTNHDGLDADGRVSAVRIEAMAGEISECVDRVARFSEGKGGDDGDEVGVHRLIESAVRSAQHLHPEAKIRVDSKPGDAIVAGGGDLQLSLVNLLDNAVRASEWSEPVEIRATSRSGVVAIEVEDHGCGMTGEVLERAFDAFWSTRADGGGLGLTSVRNTVFRLGGDVQIESEPGGGCLVRVTLPDRAVASQDESAGTATIPSGDTTLPVTIP